jgi:ABC-2 type transport system permease protein
MKSRVGSSGQRSPWEGLAPFWAIVRADLNGLFRSRLTYGWLLAAVFIEMLTALGAGSGATVSSVTGAGLSDFVYIWSLVIIGLAASSVSSEAGELADSIMSKSVTRVDYVLAKFASRIAYTLVCFVLVMAVLVGLALKLEAADYTGPGLASAVLVVALMLVGLTTMGVGLSVVMRNTVMAIVTLLVVWYTMTLFFPVVGFAALSPGSVAGDLPGTVTGAWGWRDWDTVVGFVAISGASTALACAYFYRKDI